MHAESLKAWNITQLSSTDRITHTSFGKCVTKANEKIANHIRKFMIKIYGNAKRGSSSAWSWPSTHLTHQISELHGRRV